jgi:hypothetical protein
MIRKDGPTSLYRMFNREGELLYVGISNHFARRLDDHFGEKEWRPDVATVTVEHYPNRGTAMAAEALAIANEAPRHNLVGGVRPPVVRRDRPGRPEVGGTISTAIGKDRLAAVDLWAAEHGVKRAEAIRHLLDVALGLAVEVPSG